MDEYAAVMNPPFEYPSSSTSVSGTSDLFSSTFAMLSDTAPSYVEHQWTTVPEKLHSGYYYETPQTTDVFTPHISHINPYDPTIDLRFDPYRTPLLPAYEPYNPVISLPHHVQFNDQRIEQHAAGILQAHLQQPSSSLLIRAPLPVASPIPLLSNANRLGVTLPTATPPHNNNNQSTPSAGGSSSPEEILLAASDPDDNERVMCMACRGVYPSRRSLTGHIGRNEKCREIIGLTQQSHPTTNGQQSPSGWQSATEHCAQPAGRNYLEQLANGNVQAVGSGGSGPTIPPPPGTESAKAGAIVNGQDGLSPICPHCDRFISHYKGNIRRHVNQCGKTGGKRQKSEKTGQNGKKRKSTENREWIPDNQMSHGMYDHAHPSCASVPPMHPHLSPPSMTHLPKQEMMQPPPMMHSSGSNMTTTPKSEPSASPAAPGGQPKKEPEIPDDPYLCPYCDFLTVYKGNMKRHMNTCHINEPDCKEHKLDKMKASVLGVDPATLMEKINAHKANSTRGRRPKKKDPPPGEHPQTHHMSYSQLHLQMSPPIHSHVRMGGMHNGGMMMDYDDMGCPADPYVGYAPLPMMHRPLPILLDEPSDPLQATINHVAAVESHSLLMESNSYNM